MAAYDRDLVKGWMFSHLFELVLAMLNGASCTVTPCLSNHDRVMVKGWEEHPRLR